MHYTITLILNFCSSAELLRKFKIEIGQERVPVLGKRSLGQRKRLIARGKQKRLANRQEIGETPNSGDHLSGWRMVSITIDYPY